MQFIRNGYNPSWIASIMDEMAYGFHHQGSAYHVGPSPSRRRAFFMDAAEPQSDQLVRTAGSSFQPLGMHGTTVHAAA